MPCSGTVNSAGDCRRRSGLARARACRRGRQPCGTSRRIRVSGLRARPPTHQGTCEPRRHPRLWEKACKRGAHGRLEHPIDAGVLAVKEATASLDALLQRWGEGDIEALKAILPALYGEIHAIAVRQLRHERHLTIQPTALVHEVYLRLSGLSRMKFQDRAHFLSMAPSPICNSPEN